jgi:transcriptional regulator with XRE-family HTH domain
MQTMTEMIATTATTDQNRNRLAILVEVFELQLEEVSKVIGLSRSMLSRTLHGHSGINPEQVYAKLEKHLPEIIAKRGKAFFQVEAVAVEQVEELRKAS